MKRALVVDDKEENCEYLRAVLRGHGYEVVAAKHGAEALALAREQPPHIVISDLLMPVMDGYTLLRHWKLDERLMSIPFVVYTATYTEPEDETLAFDLGADAFLLKPLEPDELMARIRSVESHPATQVSAHPSGESGLLREYNQALIRKLEQKTIQLEDANRALQADLVARQVVEAALRESEASFRTLTEAMPQLVWVAQADGCNIFSNRRWVEFTGMTAAESQGDGWLRAFHPDDAERARDEWKLAVELGTPYSLNARIQKVDGSARTCLIRALSMQDTAGRRTRWFGTCTDVQEMIDAEERLRRTEEQLQHAQKMEAIGRLASGVAHDFNNLLSVILSYTAFLLEDVTEGSQFYRDVSEINRASERAVALTRQLLSYSRRHPVQPEVIVPGQILTEMKPMLLRLLGEDVDLVLVAPAPFGRVVADSAQLEQVVMNLAVNARDAMPRGGRLLVEVHNVTATGENMQNGDVVSGTRVRLSVIDTGTGMDAATQARIFDPFFTTKERGHGTGLGLSTVYGIVKQSGGEITVTSELGHGTRFDVCFPRTDRSESNVPARSLQVESLRGTETVLLVEDDDQVRQAVRVILERNGYDVIDARSCGEALFLSEKIEREIHILVTDVVMLHMSGPELAQRLLRTRPTMHVLYISGYADSPSTYRDALEGAFMEKPIVPDQFLRRLREVLAKPASRLGLSAGAPSSLNLARST
jgi:PAS domain S-box-containing protein